jgi:hypothetical protein
MNISVTKIQVMRISADAKSRSAKHHKSILPENAFRFEKHRYPVPERSVAQFFSGARIWNRTRAAAFFTQPVHPIAPPASWLFGSGCKPVIRPDLKRTCCAVRNAVMLPSCGGRLVHNPAVVPAAGQNKDQITIRNQLCLVNGLPRRDVVLFGADHKHRGRDILESDHLTLDREPPRSEP